MLVYGRNNVRELLLSGAVPEKILASNSCRDKGFEEIIQLAKNARIKLQFADNDALNRVTRENHQGIIAYTTEFEYSTVEDILNVAKEKNKPHFILILDGLEDPHNFGSIIRVCECFGVDGIIFSKNRAVSVTDTVMRVSAGASAYVKIAKVTNINTEIERLKKQNIWVYACELGGADITKQKFDGNLAIVVGSEGNGVSSLTKKMCDGVVTIPMYGKVNSLNASVAAGVVLYEVSRQLNKK